VKGSWLIGRLAAAALLLVVLAAILAVGLGVLAYGTGPKRSGEIEIAGLPAGVNIAWPEHGPVVIEATDEAGLWAGLGYAHAADNAWSMALWRQMALGNLAAWFPERGDLDRHARLLGFGSIARDTYRRLSDGDRAALDAYARGVQAALSQPGVAQRDEFVLVDARPEPWEPWHALAIERLVAWLGTTPPARDTAFATAAASDTALASFARADSAFRSYLALGDLDHARAFTARISDEPAFVVQLPWGRSALPLFSEVLLRRGDRTTFAATIPGTLALHAGQGDETAWVVFPTSRVAYTPYADDPPPLDHDRLVDRDGNETLLAIPRSAEGLFLTGVTARSAAPIANDTTDTTASARPPQPARAPVWRVDWPGFAAGSDVPAWRAMVAGTMPRAFTVLRGDGLRMERSGSAEALGAPAVSREVPGGLFVAATEAASFAAARLQQLLTDRPADSLVALVSDAYSPWAAARLGPLVEALGDRDELPDALIDPYAFLRGWDARYSADAIGASLFEAWLATYQIATGALPPPTPDSADAAVLKWTLSIATARLTQAYGSEPAGWRWERVQRGRLVFPVWSARDANRAAARYATVPTGRGGHPTTLLSGPSLVLGGAPGVWTLWATTSTWDRPSVRRPEIETQGFLARARSADRQGASVSIERGSRPERVLRLVPAQD
jgi:hypothetical protein